MRPVLVVVASEIGQDLAEMPLAEDQDMAQAITAERAHEPIGSNEFARGARAGVLITRMPFPVKITRQDA